MNHEAAVLPASTATTELTVIKEQHESHLEFNVMPGKSVREDLLVHEYRVGHRYAEAHFDRRYSSSMAKSPSHLIFLSVQVHTQKLLYVALCHEFGLPYAPNAPELFKMWPTKVEVRIPTLIADEDGLVQKLWIRDVKPVRDGVYKIYVETRVGTLQLSAEVPTFMAAAANIGSVA